MADIIHKLVIDSKGSTLAFIEDKLVLKNGITKEVTFGCYCHIYRINESSNFKIEMNEIAIDTSLYYVDSIRKDIMADLDLDMAENSSDDFFCSSVTRSDTHFLDTYLSIGCDIRFTYDACDYPYDNSKEILVLSTHLGEFRYLRNKAKCYKYENRYYVGYLFQATEIPSDLYKMMKRSKRAGKKIKKKVKSLGHIEHFSFNALTLQGEVLF